MKILSYNPGHDGAVALLENGRLIMSVEAEKDSNHRYSPLGISDVLDAIGEIDDIPDVICAGGWWPRDHDEYLNGSKVNVGYRGISDTDIMISEKRFLKNKIKYFSSSHERAHILCAFGMSDLPKGTSCYALVWEGGIGAFYELDADLNITLIGDVQNQPGNRYGIVYGLADPSFSKDSAYPRFSDAGKLMALASFSKRSIASPEEQELIEFLLNGPARKLSDYANIEKAPHYNAGLDDKEFRNFTGIYSDALFNVFYQFAKDNLKKRQPLIIAGGCGLNCDWNTKWRETNLFSEVFVPPVANDSGVAIGTAIDAQLYFTGNPKIEWDVYSGLNFKSDNAFCSEIYDVYNVDNDQIADMLANDLILGWVNGKYEIGPRALGNRSILAAPFQESTRVRLNEIKQREQFRPIAPVCLLEDAEKWFGCNSESPYMLFTHRAKTESLAAVTHVNGTARIQTVTTATNKKLHKLLSAFKNRTGYGVLCNTSLNFNGKGFINNINDLSAYVQEHHLDGFVVEDQVYLLIDSSRYQAYKENSPFMKNKELP